MWATRIIAAGAAVAISVDVANAQALQIELPPLADAILNGNTSRLDPVLLELLQGEFNLAFGISIGVALSNEEVALVETFTKAIAIRSGTGLSDAQAVADAFADPDLTRALAVVRAQASQPLAPVSPD